MGGLRVELNKFDTYLEQKQSKMPVYYSCMLEVNSDVTPSYNKIWQRALGYVIDVKI